ncbi:MAG: hypothetical protein AABZ65_06670 [Candidatus Omnitrophota bacterium]
MRLRYFISGLITVVVLSLFYVGQQTEVIKLAYQANKINKLRKELLDRNHHLRYNLISLKSSYHLGGKLLSENTNFEIPKQSQMVSLALPKGEQSRKRDIRNYPSDSVSNSDRLKAYSGKKEAFGFKIIPSPDSGKNINNPKFLEGIKDGMLLSALKIKEVWPISAVKSYYVDKEAQAQDFSK